MRKLLRRLKKQKPLYATIHEVLICTECGETLRKCNCAHKEMCERE